MAYTTLIVGKDTSNDVKRPVKVDSSGRIVTTTVAAPTADSTVLEPDTLSVTVGAGVTQFTASQILTSWAYLHVPAGQAAIAWGDINDQEAPVPVGTGWQLINAVGSGNSIDLSTFYATGTNTKTFKVTYYKDS